MTFDLRIRVFGGGYIRVHYIRGGACPTISHKYFPLAFSIFASYIVQDVSRTRRERSTEAVQRAMHVIPKNFCHFHTEVHCARILGARLEFMVDGIMQMRSRARSLHRTYSNRDYGIFRFVPRAAETNQTRSE